MAGAIAFLQALVEADRRANEIESRAQPVFEEALVAEMQRLHLIGEEHKRGRSNGGLGDVVNLHFAARGRSAALEIDVCKPPIQLAGGNAAPARLDHAVDQRVELFGALARERREENDRRIGEEFQFLPDHRLVIREKLGGIRALARFLAAVRFLARGFFLRRFEGETHLFIAMITERPDCSA